uniref:Uncharacterized protein n=1 Tax=Arundo donax TaxID=35708 RepID=A0A0A9ESV5_ARUDO
MACTDDRSRYYYYYVSKLQKQSQSNCSMRPAMSRYTRAMSSAAFASSLVLC